MMTKVEQQAAAKDFAEKWQGHGDEKQDSQRFWIELLQKVYGVEDPASFVRFETRVKLSHTSFIDVMIPATHTMIEQKSMGKDLNAPIKQSDGTFLKPSEQAKRYAAALPYSERPRWIISCNFQQFQIFDMERPNDDPQIVELANLPTEYYRLQFMVDVKDSHIQKEMEISKSAGDLVARLYNALLPLYQKAPQLTDEQATEYLNKLCVRLVFCLYAEDAGLFGKRNMFHDYLEDYRPQHFSKALSDLFAVLDTKLEDRDPFLEEGLAQFPYVNGSLFAEKVPVPPMDEATRRLILEDACNFDWSQISPTIFGAIFESTLNPDTRRHGGMHYTSIENIHKVIDPLFLDEYKEKFQEAMNETVLKKRMAKLKALQDELAAGQFFDPACGSGNFLTESYLSLRRLENDILRETVTDAAGSGVLGFEEEEFNPIKIKITQFYGIEINDFAVSVAKTAIWIAEAQMFQETEGIVHREMDFLPLTTNANIHEGNALQMDWKEILPPNNHVRIMGNPPFVGKKEQSREQKADLLYTFDNARGVGNLDYVCAWYKKAADYIQKTHIKGAFVSTNSITQGEQAPTLWKFLRTKIQPFFAYQTFVWDSEVKSKDKAHVHVVIIGFCCASDNIQEKVIYRDGQQNFVENISPYMSEGNMVIIESRTKPICSAPPMMYGSMPIDKGYFTLSEEDVKSLLHESLENKKFIREYIGGIELLHNTKKWCLWLNHHSPREISKSQFIMDRVKKVKEFRISSGRKQTQSLADVPFLFGEIRQPDSDMLVIPKVSSERRRYIPIGFVPSTTIVSGSALIIPDADMYIFGVMESNVHNSWMRLVAGRMKSDYQYSKNVVYNNFPWPNPTNEQRDLIEKTAQGILDARSLYPDSSLADLYDEVLMPLELRKAHRANDKAVMQAYGFWGKLNSESECVAKLMKMYERLTVESKK